MSAMVVLGPWLAVGVRSSAFHLSWLVEMDVWRLSVVVGRVLLAGEAVAPMMAWVPLCVGYPAFFIGGGAADVDGEWFARDVAVSFTHE